jgi:DNA-binding response OmpR family regulator
MRAKQEWRKAASSERRQRPKKGIVVIVDDRLEDSEELARELESYGYHTVTTQDVIGEVRIACCRRTVAIIADIAAVKEDDWPQLRRLSAETVVIAAPVRAAHPMNGDPVR